MTELRVLFSPLVSPRRVVALSACPVLSVSESVEMARLHLPCRVGRTTAVVTL